MRMAFGNYSQKKQSPQKKYYNRNQNKGGSNVKNVKAVAPYNFIPLNEKVVYSQWEWNNIPGFQSYSKDKLSGEIKVTIQTITPVFIRGMKKRIEDEKQKNSEFYKINENAAIPGTSLRGLTRNMLEIISFGKFNNFEDKTLFYRGLADISSLRKEYNINMSSVDGKSIKYKFNAGYLQKNGFDYQIIPAVKNENNVQFERFKMDNSEKKLKFTFFKQPDGSFKVFSGPMGNKKKGWLIYKPDYNTKAITIPEEDIESYKLDFENKVQSDKSENLLEKCKNTNIVPCFYVRWKDSKEKDRVAFGHTGFFRLAYNKSIDDHVPQFLKKTDKPDMSEAIFGDTEHIASRVAFEDANFVGDKNNCFEQTTSPKILSSPKPTTFQHYLEQPEGLKTPKNKLNHWNRNTPIRGHKLYWHKENASWSEGKIINDTQHTIITPIKKGATFEGLIRFENLTEVELGALLFTLELKENLCHKIGMAKPLGLGSIKIKPTLKLIDRQSEKGRYTSLFSTDQWHTAQNTEKDHKQYVQKFEKYICEQLGKKDASLWETERMQELKEMLDWEKTSIPGWNNKTDYLQLAEFKNRSVLPRPSEVK